ncbi:MAG TPA: STAS domain-containing protein [Chloroflexi bacterium]|jgi:anti-sigma B factor antagonist|nr:STAS domain-containing protein [Chloroflexota bacterium]
MTSFSANTCTLSLEGRIDALTAPRVDEQLEALGQTCSTIILDLSDANYISSSGLRVVLLAHRRQRQAGGELILRNVPTRIMQIFRMAGFDRILTFSAPSSPLDGPVLPTEG